MGGGVAGTIDENGTWKWGSRSDTFSDLVDGAWATSGFGGDESSVASHFSATGDGTFQITLPGSTSGSGGTGVSTDTLVIEGKIKESSEENFSRDEAAAFVFAAPVSNPHWPHKYFTNPRLYPSPQLVYWFHRMVALGCGVCDWPGGHDELQGSLA